MKARFVLAAAILTLLAGPMAAEASGLVGGVVGGVRGVVGAPERRGVRRAGYSRKSAKARRAARAARR